MNELFAVEIISYDNAKYDDIVDKCITVLGIPPNRAIKMLDKLPRLITKPMPIAKAKKVEQQLGELGVKTYLKAYQDQNNESASSSAQLLDQQNNPQINTPQITSNNGNSLENLSQEKIAEEGVTLDKNKLESPLTISDFNLAHLETALETKLEKDLETFQDIDDSEQENEDFELVSNDLASNNEFTNKSITDKDSVDSSKHLEFTSKYKREYTFSVRGTFLRAFWAGVVLIVLTIGFVTFNSVRFILYAQLLSNTQQHAVIISNHLEYELDSTKRLEEKENLLVLQKNLQLVKQSFSGSSINFAVIADSAGKVLSSWFDDPEEFKDLNQNILHATSEITKFIVNSQELEGSLRHPLNKSQDLLAHPIRLNEQALGTVFLGINKSSITPHLQQLFFNILFITLLALFLAFFLVTFLLRHLFDDITSLVHTTNKLSLGDWEANTQVKSNNELRSLAKGLEYLRDKLKSALENK